MDNNVDYVGAKSVAQIIEHTGLTHFIISRISGTRNSAPIYEFLSNNSNSKCLDAFNRWANITDNNNEYEMLLFNKILTNSNDVDAEKILHNRNKEQSLRFTFTLLKNNNQNTQNNNQNIDVSQAIENALMKHTQAIEERESNRKIQALESKIDALLNRELEEEEEEEEENLGALGGNNLTNLIGLLTKLTGNKTNTPPPINGVTLDSDKIKNINIAIKKLAKYDSQIDLDLLKLSEIAENNNGTFQMLLNSLRSM